MVNEQDSHETRFTHFIEDFKENGNPAPKYDLRIGEMPVKGLESLVVDFNDLYAFDIELAQLVIDDPEPLFPILNSVVKTKLRIKDALYAESLIQINVRFGNLPMETPLRNIGAKHVSKLVMTHGIIVRAASVKPYYLVANFMCPICHTLIKYEQSGQVLSIPSKCPSCDNRKGFKVVPRESVLIDSQGLTIQEVPEDLPPGQLPRSLKVDLKNDVVNIARPGDRVTITGIITLLPTYGRGGELLTSDIQLETNFMQVRGRELELMEISPEDEASILETSKDPWVFKKILGSIVPSIYGYEHIKESILYLLFGGVPKDLPDMRIKGDINVLLVGDPGTAKSQMLTFTTKAAPRGLMTTGRGSSAAGLTAAVVKEGGTGSFVLEAGALVLADKGVCCIDEIDKMRDEDRGAIHPAMEQQKVPIAKGGIVATLNSRTSILAAANPSLGRYNPYQTIAQNITLPPTLLSRFDLIWILKDQPDSQKDADIAQHILELHNSIHPVEPPLEIDFLKKYISYAKKVDPKINNDVIERLKDFYVKMRNASVEGGKDAAIAITARQLEGLVRIAEARARVHLRKEISVEDAEAAINIMRKSLEQVGVDIETGQIDIDILYSGKPRSLQNQLQKVLCAITKMENISGSVRDDDLYEELMEKQGIGRTEAVRLIGVLMKDGTIFSPRPGYYRRTN